MNSHSKAAIKGWIKRRKKFGKKKIKEQQRKGGIKSAQKRWGYKQSYDEVL